MEKANIIISIIIVLCIAAGVAAYGLSNPDNNLFSDLASISDDGTSGSGSGIGNNTTNPSNTHGAGVGSGSGSGSGSGVSGGSGSGSGSGSGGGSSSGGSTIKISQSQAKAIAQSHILQEGWYAGTPVYRTGFWYVPVYDTDGNTVDSIAVNARTGATNRG